MKKSKKGSKEEHKEMQKQHRKEIALKFFLSFLLLITIHLAANNNVINGFIISVVFDLFVVKLGFDINEKSNKAVITRICKTNNLYFNEHFYEFNHSVSVNRLKILWYSWGIILPIASKTLYEWLVKVIDNITSIEVEAMVTFSIVIVWAIVISYSKKQKMFHELHAHRVKTNKNKYPQIDEKHRLYIDDYDDEELKILNNGKSIPVILSANQQSNNP